jgi:hypothetical protein
MQVEELLDEEVTAPACEPYARKAAAVGGRNPGPVGLAGQRVAIHVSEGSEIPPRCYEALLGDGG